MLVGPPSETIYTYASMERFLVASIHVATVLENVKDVYITSFRFHSTRDHTILHHQLFQSIARVSRLILSGLFDYPFQILSMLKNFNRIRKITLQARVLFDDHLTGRYDLITCVLQDFEERFTVLPTAFLEVICRFGRPRNVILITDLKRADVVPLRKLLSSRKDMWRTWNFDFASVEVASTYVCYFQDIH